jgi:CRISPR-associated protein Cpf1
MSDEVKNQNSENIFSKFKNLYSLTKTLRFELKPVGNTLNKMYEQLEYDENLQTFLKDYEIEQAYQTLKPELDKLHEEFINDSLNSDEAKKLSFEKYFEEYKKNDRKLEEKESDLRKEIDKLYKKTSEEWTNKENGKYSKYDWKKGNVKATSFNILLTKDALHCIKDKKENQQDARLQGVSERKGAIDQILEFYGYLSGYNQNRANYYVTEKEASTAVATRIVHENLPKFCDNFIQFEGCNKQNKKGENIEYNRKSEYLSIYKYLKDNDKITQVKDSDIDEMIELYPISEEIFNISNFTNCLSQNGIENYNKTIGHYNSLINLYNQARLSEKKSLNKDQQVYFKKLKQFKTLFKQIGCGKKDPLFFKLTHNTTEQALINNENYEKPYSLEQILKNYTQAVKLYFNESVNKGDESKAVKTILDLKNYILEKQDYNDLYWSKQALNTISNNYFANWYDLAKKLHEIDKKSFSEDKNNLEIKIPQIVQLSQLFDALDQTEGDDWKDPEKSILFKNSIFSKTSPDLEKKKSDRKRNILKQENIKPSLALLQFIFADIDIFIEEIHLGEKEILNIDYAKFENDQKYNPETKEKIKLWLDKIKTVLQIIKYFSVSESKIKNGGTLDEIVANTLKNILFEAKLPDQIEIDWFKWYDVVRNFLTKKPQDEAKENKLKLNFGKSGLLKGWAETGKDKKAQYNGYILRENGKYYLGVSTYDQFLSDTKFPEIISNTEFYEKLEYKQLDWGKNITGGKVYPSYTKAKLGNEISFQHHKKLVKSEKEHVNFVLDLIKEKYLSRYPEIQALLDIEYQNMRELQLKFGEIKIGGISFVRVSKTWVETGEIKKNGKENYHLYLFEIKNKDFRSSYKTATKNQHTLYWENLFSDKNIENTVLDLGANAEIFYRNVGVKEKQVKNGYDSKPWVIENKRFTSVNSNSDKSNYNGKQFFFHCPVSLNKEAKSYSKPEYSIPVINDIVADNFSQNPDTYYLGIDRGEKHLAYYCLINQNAKIVKQGSLNLSFTDKDGKPRTIKTIKKITKEDGTFDGEYVECENYNELLEARAGNRDFARKNWQAIDSIKNLKNGYISQVVRKIANLAVNLDDPKPTYIILEDLNTGFKRGRQKIEKQVYQKFELALAKKLNFLVDKTKTDGIGSVTKAIQLTPPVANYSDIEDKKQVGAMLYTRANYTSQTDPLTGWRKSIYIQKGSEEYIKTQILGDTFKNNKQERKFEPTFTDIYWENGDYVFVYTDKNSNKVWKLYSGKNGKSLDRFRGKRGDKNEWQNVKVDINEVLNRIFEKFNKQHKILDQIHDEVELVGFGGMKPWDSLRFAIDLIQQIRNTGGEKRDEDFIFSPVRNEKTGNHFDSREYLDKLPGLDVNAEVVENLTLPICGDANGAFNIARKGLIMNEHIKRWIINSKPKNKDKSDLNLFVSEWDLWLNNKEKWESKLGIFASQKDFEKYIDTKNKKE